MVYWKEEEFSRKFCIRSLSSIVEISLRKGGWMRNLLRVDKSVLLHFSWTICPAAILFFLLFQFPVGKIWHVGCWQLGMKRIFKTHFWMNKRNFLVLFPPLGEGWLPSSVRVMRQSAYPSHPHRTSGPSRGQTVVVVMRVRVCACNSRGILG